MQYLFILVIVLLILYFLIIGGIIVWPIINVLAYLKVLLFPWPIRRKYGASLSNLSKDSFDKAITEADKIEMSDLHSSIDVLKSSIPPIYNEAEKEIEKVRTRIIPLDKKINAFSYEIKKLGPLKKNNDGTYSQRSANGKKAFSIAKQRDKVIRSKSSLEYDINYGIPEKAKKEEKKVKSSISRKNKAIKDIKNKPWVDWHLWCTRYARYSSNKSSIIFMFVGFPALFALLTNYNNFSYVETFHIYAYISYIQPISDFFGVESFKYGISSNFFSYEYALDSLSRYKSMFTFWNWVIYTLTMPVLTYIIYISSYKHFLNKSTKVEPDTY